MGVILNNSSFQFSKVHAQFQGCWHKKKLEHLCMAALNSYEKKLFMILAMISVSKMKKSVHNLIGLEDSCICEHYLTDFFCQLRLLKTHKYARK